MSARAADHRASSTRPTSSWRASARARSPALLGFDAQDQTRITTAVSEIARNAFEYGGGGRVEFGSTGERARRRCSRSSSPTRGPGIADLAAMLAGVHRSTTGMGIGIARRAAPDGRVRDRDRAGPGHRRAHGQAAAARARLSSPAPTGSGSPRRWRADEPLDPIAEIRQQNQEMLVQLEELNERAERARAAQPRAGGHQPRRRRALRRARRARRPSAPRRRAEVALPVQHEPRVPHAAELDPGAVAPAAVARRRRADAEQEKQVHFIRKAAENLTELVNDLLDLAKVEAGKIVVTPVEFTVADLFGALRGMLRPLLVGDAVALVFESRRICRRCYTDEGKVSQILRNFISNALKFTERGEVRVCGERRRRRPIP